VAPIRTVQNASFSAKVEISLFSVGIGCSPRWTLRSTVHHCDIGRSRSLGNQIFPEISSMCFPGGGRPRAVLNHQGDDTMELRDLLCLDVEALSSTQAEYASRDIIAALAQGGITGADQNQLKSLLVAAKRKALPAESGQPDTRTRVKQLIEEAEARGDKRSA
jgi:hypothetical protein